VKMMVDCRGSRKSDCPLNTSTGCAIAQAVSSQLATMAAWGRAQVKSCGICGGQSSTRTGFLEVHKFPLPIITPTATHLSSSAAGTIG
jgi:hypothetical protein